MSGRDNFIRIGKKIIELVRQKCFKKYGSGLLIQKDQRKLTEFQDQQRCWDARYQIQIGRHYLIPYVQNNLQIPYLQTMKQTQAGNCTQMSVLSFQILKDIVPPGIIVQHRRKKHQIPGQRHWFVAIKPQSLKNDDQTLIIDPWPSNQLINAQVVTQNQFFCNQFQYQLLNLQIRPQKLSKPCLNFDEFKYQDFNLKQLDRVEEYLTNDKKYQDPTWKWFLQKCHQQNKFDFFDMVVHEEEDGYKRFKKGRKLIKYARKT